MGAFPHMLPPLPPHLWIFDGIYLLYVFWCLATPLAPCLTCWWGIFFFRGALFLRSTILFICLSHTLKYRHGFFYALLHMMELDIFIAIVFHDITVVLSDVIYYHYPFYMVI